MTQMYENPDGTRTFVTDEATIWAGEFLASLGPDAPELTQEQFEELVERIRNADSEPDDDDEKANWTEEQWEAEVERLEKLLKESGEW